MLLGALAWSTAGLFTRVVTTDIPTTLFWRSFFGGWCVLGYYLAFRNDKSDQCHRFSQGEIVIACRSTAGMICFISSFFFTTIANVSFAYGTMPLVTYAMALVALKARSSALKLFCCLLSAIGMLLMTYGNSSLDDYFGIALAFGMTVFMAALTIATKFFPSANTTKATYLSAFLGALIMLPLSSFDTMTPLNIFWLFLYGLVNVGLGFGVYLAGVSRVPALAAALIGLAEIPLAPIWALLLFDETVNMLVLMGGVIILTAAIIYLLNSNMEDD